MVADSVNHLVRTGIIIIVIIHVTGTVCHDQHRIIGLFKPLSYQTRAVQLALADVETDQVCFETHELSPSTPWNGICELLSDGVVAFITDQPLPSAVKHVIDTVQVPVISTTHITSYHSSSVINLTPSEEQIANALSQVLVDTSWTNVVLITWPGSGIELFMPGSSTSYRVAAVYYTDDSDVAMRSRLVKIKQSEISVIILHHYKISEVLRIFTMVKEEGLSEAPYVWILSGTAAEKLTSRVAEGASLPQLPRLLGVYPTVSNTPKLDEFADVWRGYGSVKQSQSAAYLYDAITIITQGVAEVTVMEPGFTQTNQSCDTLEVWSFGKRFQSVLEKTKSDSINHTLTTGGHVYQYISFSEFGLNKVATWTGGNETLQTISPIRWCSQQEANSVNLCQSVSDIRCGVGVSRPPSRAPPNSPYRYDYSNYNFDVVTIEAEPFVEIKGDNDTVRRFEGLCIDLMDKLSELMGFTYTISIVADGNYGAFDEETNTWTGLVKDLIDHKSQIALADFTISAGRETVIDFTRAYFDIGLRVLYKVEDRDEFTTDQLFLFLKPFETSLWLLILASIVAVSIGVAIIGRLSPYDWYQSPPDDFSLWESQFQMTLYNSIWQVLSAIFQQGAETAPRSVSARVLMGGWWFVCLVLAATYTANLTAIFAAPTIETGFNSIDELVSKIPPDVRFGTTNNTQISDFFKNSPIKAYQEAYQYMEMEGLLYDNLTEAIAAVINDKIALIMDSPIVDFISSRKDDDDNPNCTLKNIGDGLFNPSGYGLGLNKNSPYTDDFSLAILELREAGVLEQIITEYFQHRRTCDSDISRDSASAQQDSEPIDLDSVGGLFILLGTGILLSFVILLVELACARALGSEHWLPTLSYKLPWEDDHDKEILVPQVEVLSRTSFDNNTDETAGTDM